MALRFRQPSRSSSPPPPTPLQTAQQQSPPTSTMAERSSPFTRRGGNGRNGSATGNGYGGGDRITGSTSFATPSPSVEPMRNRLPTLFEVLSRRTLAPVDLFSFYIYMRDQQRSVDYLDFWYGIFYSLLIHHLKT